MSLPQRIDKCPRLPECTAQVIFKDSDGNLYRYDKKANEFVPHVCTTKGASKLPSVAYAAEWYNLQTRRTRFLGPERMRRSVEKPPTDERFRRRGAEANSVWQHKQTYIAHLDWKPASVED